MMQLAIPNSHSAIKSALAAEVEAIAVYFAAITDDEFFVAPPAVWSAADNLVHLIQSISPVNMALRLPKLALRARFGRARGASLGYAAVLVSYKQALAQGGEASGSYLPLVKAETAVEKGRVLAKWQEKGGQLVAALDSWSETDLDAYQLPHPLLGKMTVRDILFFTLYHNMHHVNDVRHLQGEPPLDWFGSSE